ncbi:MAG: glycosyltransferase [Planctomycetes bacterium]|nr:glycosyltransferase [Planctomycetota bacterium]MCC7172856.1 glycosyltransferase [Planctomycetota bacterium]
MSANPISVQPTQPVVLDLSVVIPVLTDAPELRAVLDGCAKVFARRKLKAEFVVVLDGVSDQVFDQAQRARPPGMNVRLVRLNHPFGESIALAAGFRIAQGRIVMTLPPYPQIDLDDLDGVLEAVDDGFDLVGGLRKPRVDPIMNRLQSAIFNFLMRILTGVPLRDLNCPLRAMKRKVLEDVTIQGDMVRFLPVLAHRHGFRVGEVRVRHIRERGRAGFFGVGVYVRRFLDIITLLFLSKFTRAPLRFFGVLGIIAFVLGVLLCSWITIDTLFLTGEPPRNKISLVLGVMLIVLGAQVFSIGLVGEIIIFTQAKNLKEYRLVEEAEDQARRKKRGDSSSEIRGGRA